jgi:hypothetical protein
MALVDPNEEPRLWLLRRHEDEPFPAHKQAERLKVSKEEADGFRSAPAARGEREDSPDLGEVKRLRRGKNPSGRWGLYSRRGGGSRRVKSGPG